MLTSSVPAPNNKSYLLIVLLVILAFNTADRLALGLLLQQIKIDLDLNDTQLGFLTGIAFALFYSVMGIPIARWADRGNRIAIISATTAIWSAAVALCGFAGSFLQLLWIRVGVAVGEAGCVPPAHSLIADHFERAQRSRAVAVYMLGGPSSFVIGYFLAGWLNELYGWRATFVLLGLPGLALAALVRFSLREPRRHNVEPLAPVPGLKETCTALWANRTFRHLLFCFCISSFFTSGIWQWQPAFFVRSFGMESGELGTWLTVLYGLGGLIGTYVGGALAARYAADNEPLQLKSMALIYAAFGVCSALIYLVPDRYTAFGLMGLAAVGGTTITGPLFAIIQTLVPGRMRALSIALIYFCANLLGMGLGPLLVGVLSDALHPQFGAESLRYALVALCPGYAWAAAHLWKASRTVFHDLQSVTTP